VRKIKIYVILSPKKAGFHSMTGRLLACRRGEPRRNIRLWLKGGDGSYPATGKKRFRRRGIKNYE
jgi:hypothetical protein